MLNRSCRLLTTKQVRRFPTVALIFGLLLVGESGAAATTPLSLEAHDLPCPGPICARPTARPYQNLAGFSLVVGSILFMAARRESKFDPFDPADPADAGPKRR